MIHHRGVKFQGRLSSQKASWNGAAPKLMPKRAPKALIGNLEADSGGGLWGRFGPLSPWKFYCGNVGASRLD